MFRFIPKCFRIQPRSRFTRQSSTEDGVNIHVSSTRLECLIRGMAHRAGCSIPNVLMEIVIEYFLLDSWKFMDQHIRGCVISNDGKTLEVNSGYTSVQFGPFFNSNQKIVCKFQLKMAKCGYCGVGFITREFTAFQRNRWNDGNNDSMMLYSNGYNPWSNALSASIGNKALRVQTNWCQDNDEIIVKINTKCMRVLVWNYTKLQKDDIDFAEVDSSSKNENSSTNYKLVFDLPKNKDIAMIVDAGALKQTIIVTNQWITHAAH